MIDADTIHAPRTDRLPLSPLLALATAVFITTLTETLPAGLLTQMSDSLRVGDSAMGQSITIYAVGTALTAIPLSAATARWRRKPLLLVAVAGFLAANTLTALAPTYAVAMVARFLAGVTAGVAWSMLAGYARRLASAHLAGRAIAVAMSGIPIALCLGVPAGTLLGQVLDWRAAFGAMSLLALVVVIWIVVSVADFPGVPHASGSGTSMLAAAKVPGVPAVLAVTLTFVLGHTIIYSYVASYVAAAEMAQRIDLVLLVFGVTSLVSVWIVGSHVDRELRSLTIGCVTLVAAATLTLAISQTPVAVYVAAAAWGLGWGGAPTLLQAAGVIAGGRHSDAAADGAQTMLVTLWNVAMALGGSVGGVILTIGGVTALPAATVLLCVPALFIVVASRRHGFTDRVAEEWRSSDEAINTLRGN
jgi:predicted MFS family arabinose efflux permease